MNLEKEFNLNMDKAINNFQYIYPSFSDKIKFLKELNSSPDLLSNNKYRNLLEESMYLLVKNAKITETRKMQQKLILPILTKLFQHVPVDEVSKDFEKDQKSFAIFCITALSFKYESTMKSHGEEHHKNIIEVLEKYTSELSNL